MSKNNFGEKKKVSAFSVIEIIVIIILAVMIAGMVVCNLMFRSDNKPASIFGYSFYKTRAVNMVPEIPVNTVIVAKKSEIPNIIDGSVILCTIGEKTALTRVTEIEQQEDGSVCYIVKFDIAPENETFRVESDAVIAKAIWQNESFGKFLDFATSVPGIITAVIIPLVFVVIFQLIRIRNIRELEREASSIDDIDDIIVAHKAENPPPVTFTEPKFTEDVTGKLPAVKPRLREEEKPKARLTVDANGRADYKVEKNIISTEAPPFIKLEGFTAELPKQPAAVGAKAASAAPGELYLNRPTKIEPLPQEELLPKASAENESRPAEKAVFTPHLSNVIPESLVNIQEEAAASNARPTFDDSVKAYFEKSERRAVSSAVTEQERVPTIPEKAVVPKENIAPVRKKKNSRTLEELMSIIDSEESKLKK